MKFKWDKKYLYWSVAAFCVIVCSIVFFQLTSKWGVLVSALGKVVKVLMPFIYGFVIAYVLNGVMTFFEEKLFAKLSARICRGDNVKAGRLARIFAIVLTQLLLFGVSAGLLVLILPQLYYSIVGIVEKSSTYLEIAVEWLERIDISNTKLEATAVRWLNTASEHLISWIETDVLPQISTLITSITGGVLSIIKGVINLFIGDVISIYIMYRKENFTAQSKKCMYSIMKPKTANRFMDELAFVDVAFGNYIAGEIIDSLIVGIINYIFMLIVGMPYAALISIIMCLTNLIPIFGPFIGAIPSAILILFESPMQCLVFAIFTLVLQQLDGNVLKPRIQGKKAGLSGFWVMFAILFFGGLFGIVGMLVGVPVLSVIYNAVKRRSMAKLKAKGLPTETEEYERISRISSETNRPVYKAGEEEKEPAEETE